MLATSWRHSVSQLGLDNSVVEAFLFASGSREGPDANKRKLAQRTRRSPNEPCRHWHRREEKSLQAVAGDLGSILGKGLKRRKTSAVTGQYPRDDRAKARANLRWLANAK